ncbi:MAG: P-loop NTPase [Halodesulfurarchaeum sp.]
MTAGAVYAVASGKGGVGKSTTAINLGAAFVEADRSAVVVDVDLGMANLADLLAVDSIDPTLHEVLSGEADIEDAILEAPGGFDVVLGSTDLESFGRADPAALGPVIEALRESHDLVVLDGSGGLSHDVTVPLGLADGVLIVTTPAEASITNAIKTRELVERLDGTVEGVIVNRIGGAGEATPADIGGRIGAEVLGSVPEDGAVQVSETEGTPLVTVDRESPAAQSFREIAYGLLEEPLPRTWEESAESDTEPPASAVPEDVASSDPTADTAGERDDRADRSESDGSESRSLLSRMTGGLLG